MAKTPIQQDALHKLKAAIDTGVVIDWDSLEKRTNVTASMLDIIGSLFQYLYPQFEEGLSHEKRKIKHTNIWKKQFLPTRGKDDDLLKYVRRWLKNTDGPYNEQISLGPVRSEQNLQYYKNQIEELQKEIALLKNHLEKASLQNEKLKSDDAVKNNKIVSLLISNEEYIDKNNQLKQVIDVCNGSISQLKDKEKNYLEKQIKIENENENLKSKQNELEQNFRSIKKKYSALKSKEISATSVEI